MREDLTMELSDGRRLGYAEYGDPSGTPFFYFHGTPGSRYEARFSHQAAQRKGVRLVAVDRPGYGLSDFKPGRQFRQWPDDVVQLADHLGFDRFGVMGLSGGGPHALACALQVPDRVTVAGVVSGAGMVDAYHARNGSKLGRLFSRLSLPFVRLLFRFFVMWMAFWLPRISARRLSRFADPDVLARQDAREQFRAELLEGLRPGRRAATQEFILHTRPWKMDLSRLAVPVYLWHGEADAIVKPDIARWMAGKIPGVRATFWPRAGHLAIVDHIGEILDTLTTAVPAGRAVASG